MLKPIEDDDRDDLDVFRQIELLSRLGHHGSNASAELSASLLQSADTFAALRTDIEHEPEALLERCRQRGAACGGFTGPHTSPVQALGPLVRLAYTSEYLPQQHDADHRQSKLNPPG